MPTPPKKRESHDKLKVIGKSGLFHMDNRIDVEYLQTTITVEQINEIEPVRRIFKRGTLPFDLMMQRELDDERIITDLIPYLLDNELAFFPPITVVILDVDKTAEMPIKELYPKLILNNNYQDGDENIYQKREYGNLFNIDILKDGEELQRWFTELTVKPSATLLAIDGQHRLVALQSILNKLPSDEESIYNSLDKNLQEKIKTKDFSNLSIPITFIFVPKLYEGNEHGITLVEGFRKIFVDINRNARKVNEMRNVLLDEQDLRSIFTRKLCAKIQDTSNSSSITIDEIEWEKTSRENQLSNPLAITNVLFLRDIFAEWVGKQTKSGTDLKIVMGLDEFSSTLDEDENFPYSSLDIDSFSFHQKDFIIDIFNTNYLCAFFNLINSLPFVLKRSEIVNEIRVKLDDEIRCSTTSSEIIFLNKIKDVLFDGEEKNIHLKDPTVKLRVEEEIALLTKFQTEKGLDLVRTKLFQISYYSLFFDLFNDKSIQKIDNFKQFSEFVNQISKTNEFNNLWIEVFVQNKPIIDKGLKGHRGYSASSALIETMKSILLLFIYKILNTIELSEAIAIASTKIEKARKRILSSFISKHESDLWKIYDEEKDVTTRINTFEKEIKSFLEILN